MTEPTYKSKIKKKKPPFDFKNVKVPNLYFCPFPEIRAQLNILKMRNSRVSLTNAMNSVKSKKCRQTRNNHNFTDSYMDLFVFDCPKLAIFHAVVKLIKEYNSKAWANSKNFMLIYIETPQFLVFYEKLMKRVAAATIIQINYKAYSARKLENQGTLLIEKLVKKRAIFCIQQFWRNYKMKRRLKAL